jgi:hypothetical protein
MTPGEVPVSGLRAMDSFLHSVVVPTLQLDEVCALLRVPDAVWETLLFLAQVVMGRADVVLQGQGDFQ